MSFCFNCAYSIVPGAVDILKQSKTLRRRKCSFSMDEVMHTGFLLLENNSFKSNIGHFLRCLM